MANLTKLGAAPFMHAKKTLGIFTIMQAETRAYCNSWSSIPVNVQGNSSKLCLNLYDCYTTYKVPPFFVLLIAICVIEVLPSYSFV